MLNGLIIYQIMIVFIMEQHKPKLLFSISNAIENITKIVPTEIFDPNNYFKMTDFKNNNFIMPETFFYFTIMSSNNNFLYYQEFINNFFKKNYSENLKNLLLNYFRNDISMKEKIENDISNISPIEIIIETFTCYKNKVCSSLDPTIQAYFFSGPYDLNVFDFNEIIFPERFLNYIDTEKNYFMSNINSSNQIINGKYYYDCFLIFCYDFLNGVLYRLYRKSNVTGFIRLFENFNFSLVLTEYEAN